MIRRLVWIAALTGIGQLLSIFALKYVSQHDVYQQLKAIAQIDSLVQFLMNIIAMGLQSAAMRDLALTPDWQTEYRHVQSARLTLGLLLIILTPLAFINVYYLLFLFAPMLAWNGDYALYARGHSTTGAAVALVRQVVPFVLLILMARLRPDWLAGTYLIALTGTYILTNIFIAVYLRTPLVSLPNWGSLRLYFNSLPLGIVILSMYMIGLGLMMVVPYFYNDAVVAVGFVGLKFYVIFKGVIRMIHQAFIKDMARYDVCFKVDQLTSLIGLTFMVFILIFPDTLIRLFFGEKYLSAREYFIMLAIAAQVYSLFSSLTIKGIFEKKDRLYATIAVFSAVITVVVCILVSFAVKTASGIGICLIAGEVVFAMGMLYLLRIPALWKERLLFLSKNLPLLLVPLCISRWTGDKPAGLIIAGAVFAVVIIMLHHRKFRIAAVG